MNEIYDRVFELSCTQVKTYGPETNISPTFIWGYNNFPKESKSQRFQLCQFNHLTGIGLHSGKKSMNWVSVGILDTLR